MKHFIRGLTIGLAVFLTAAGAFAQTNDKLGTFLNGETITKGDFSAYVERRIDLKGAVRNARSAESVLNEMALTRALSMEGESNGVPKPARNSDSRFDDIYAKKIYQTLLPTCKRPADAVAARKYFDEHPDAFRVPTTARLNRIMLPQTSIVEGVPASDWMVQRAQSIRAGTETFESAALRAEKLYGLEVQGDLGWVTLTDNLPVMRMIASSRQGEMLGPLQEGDFLYLFQIIQKREGRQLSWDEAAAEAPQQAENYCREKANEQIKSAMLKKYGFKLDESAIKAMFDEK